MHNFCIWPKRVLHEEEHPVNGNLFVYCNSDKTLFFVCWRQDRRHIWAKTLSLGCDSFDDALKQLPNEARYFTPPKQFKSSKKRDAQRQRVYDWENKNLRKLQSLAKRLRRTEVFQFFHHVCGELQLDPDLKLTTKGSGYCDTATYAHHKKTVNLPAEWAYTNKTVLPEIAHHLADAKNDKFEIQPHGPEFMKGYIHLLTLFSRVGQKRLVDSLTRTRVKFDLYQETSDGT